MYQRHYIILAIDSVFE